MELTENRQFKVNETEIKFLRVQITDLHDIITEILETLLNLSWLNELSNDLLREGFLACAEPTIKKITQELQSAEENENITEIGEYVVSNVARIIVEKCYDYYVLPLAELIKEKVSNNPGFDYHFESKEHIPIFGEAKYVAKGNGYGRALSQVVDFISEQKDKKEIQLLMNFMSEEAINNIVLLNKGYSISFSTNLMSTEELIKNIMKNTDFNKLLNNKEIIIVAVDIL